MVRTCLDRYQLRGAYVLETCEVDLPCDLLTITMPNLIVCTGGGGRRFYTDSVVKGSLTTEWRGMLLSSVTNLTTLKFSRFLVC